MKVKIKYTMIGFGIGVIFTFSLISIIDFGPIPFHSRYEVKVQGSVVYKIDKWTGRTWQKQYRDYSWHEIN